MSLDLSGIELLFKTVWHWMFVISLLIYVIGFAVRWVQTYEASDGHFYIGIIAVSVSTLFLIVVVAAPEFAWFFAPFPVFWTGCWLFYNDWYFFEYPNYKQWLADPTVRPNTFGMNNALAKLLIHKGGADPFWGGTGFKVALGVFAFVFLVGFGFVEKVNEIARGDRRVANVTKNVASTTMEVVKKEVQTAVGKEVAPLREGQLEIKEYATQAVLVASQSRQASESRFKILDKKADRAAQAASLAALEAQRLRRSSAVPVAPLRPSVENLRNLPSKITFPPTDPVKKNARPRSGKFGHIESPADTTYYVLKDG